jgi:hypothetical protein
MFPARGSVFAGLFVVMTLVQAQAEEKENGPFAIIELGAAGAWEGTSSSFGQSVAVSGSRVASLKPTPLTAESPLLFRYR